MPALETISAGLSLVPAIVWSGLAASILTLSGVFLSNESNTKRLKLHLEHDANEKAKERTATLRRDVYLSFSEKLTRAGAHLAMLVNINPESLADGNNFQEFLAIAAKLQLIAEPETAILVGKLSANYSEIYLRLLGDLEPLNTIRNSKDINRKSLDSALSENRRVIVELTKLKESAQPNDAVVQALLSTYKFNHDNATRLIEEQKILSRKFILLMIDFSKQLLVDVKSTSKQQLPVMLAIRRDLGLKGDLSVFQSQMEEQLQRLCQQADSMLDSLAQKSAQTDESSNQKLALEISGDSTRENTSI